MRLLKVPKFEPRVLKDWEFENLYQSASPHFKPIPLCAYMTRMRRGEIAKLKWQNVDLEDGIIHLVETKNNESRSIPIAKSLLDTIKVLKSKTKTEFVFTTHEGNPYTHPTVWKSAWETAVRVQV
jgi:integrase